MLNRDNLSKLIDEYNNVKTQINSFDKVQLDEIIDLSEWLQNLINESIRIKKLSSSKDSDIRHLIKMNKKKEKQLRDIYHYEATVNDELGKGAIPNDISKRLLDIVKPLKIDKFDDVNSKFNYFKVLFKYKKTFDDNKDKLVKEKELIETEIKHNKQLVKDLKALDNYVINDEQVQLYSTRLIELNKLKVLRSKYVQSLVSLPITNLIEQIINNSLIDYGFPNKNEQELDVIRSFFKEEKYFSKMKVNDVRAMSGFSDDKIRHIYPELSKYKRIILSNMYWFDKISNLQNTEFVLFIDCDEKLINYYVDNIQGAKNVLDMINQDKGQMIDCKRMYELDIKYKGEMDRLSKYSVINLEKEIIDYTINLELINNKDNKNVNNDGNALITKLKSFFKFG